jgi:hypothetical protein
MTNKLDGGSSNKSGATYTIIRLASNTSLMANFIPVC